MMANMETKTSKYQATEIRQGMGKNLKGKYTPNNTVTATEVAILTPAIKK